MGSNAFLLLRNIPAERQTTQLNVRQSSDRRRERLVTANNPQLIKIVIIFRSSCPNVTQWRLLFLLVKVIDPALSSSAME